ncbi:MAG TPA: SGNH/GDSL hydrolase family protein [Polyangia bacterium]|nr:SGNH/GDSL hydrolase family protein [Polyangia bacterium]
MSTPSGGSAARGRSAARLRAAIAAYANSQWDFSSWQPQAVVINLGTNDLSTASDPTQAQFTAAYRAFLQRVRGKYPGALILCTVAPLLGGAELTAARAYINEAITALGDPRVKSLDLAPTDPNDGWGCDFHPSVKTHQKMAVAVTRPRGIRRGR